MINVKAFQDLGMASREFQKALDEDNVMKQEIALRSMSEAIEEALATMMAARGLKHVLN
jgi:hypothetical protein